MSREACDEERRFPLFVPCKGKTVTVVGGGAVAARRIGTLAKFPFAVRVIAPAACADILRRAEAGELQLVRAAYDGSGLADSFFVLACTNDDACNRRVVRDCRAQGIPVNSCSCAADCDFYFPAVITRGPLTAALAGDGSDHAAVRAAADTIREALR